MSEHDEQEVPPLYYGQLDHFVNGYLVFIYRRALADGSTKGARWCPKWWYHEEAVARLEAMWRSWELLRLDPAAGMSNWFLQHGDPHMRVLWSEDGPFQYCKSTHVDRMKVLPVYEAPAGLFAN